MHGRALFCFRSGDFLSDIKDAEKRRVYVEGPTDGELHELGAENAERRAAVRRQQLADLKSRIRALSPPMPLFDGYPCTWEAAGSSRREGVLPKSLFFESVWFMVIAAIIRNIAGRALARSRTPRPAKLWSQRR